MATLAEARSAMAGKESRDVEHAAAEAPPAVIQPGSWTLELGSHREIGSLSPDLLNSPRIRYCRTATEDIGRESNFSGMCQTLNDTSGARVNILWDGQPILQIWHEVADSLYLICHTQRTGAGTADRVGPPLAIGSSVAEACVKLGCILGAIVACNGLEQTLHTHTATDNPALRQFVRKLLADGMPANWSRYVHGWMQIGTWPALTWRRGSLLLSGEMTSSELFVRTTTLNLQQPAQGIAFLTLEDGLVRAVGCVSHNRKATSPSDVLVLQVQEGAAVPAGDTHISQRSFCSSMQEAMDMLPRMVVAMCAAAKLRHISSLESALGNAPLARLCANQHHDSTVTVRCGSYLNDGPRLRAHDPAMRIVLRDYMRMQAEEMSRRLDPGVPILYAHVANRSIHACGQVEYHFQQRDKPWAVRTPGTFASSSALSKDAPNVLTRHFTLFSDACQYLEQCLQPFLQPPLAALTPKEPASPVVEPAPKRSKARTRASKGL